MKIKSEQLKEYITTVLKSIEEGLVPQKFYLDGSVEFDLAVSNTSEGSGGIKIYIVSAKGRQKAEEITRIKFKARPNAESKLRKSSTS